MAQDIPRKATLIFNESSGSEANEKVALQAQTTLAENGIQLQCYRGQAGEDLAEAARAAIAGGSGYVLGAGGDGTLRAVAQAVADTNAVMGILPVGTLNHFARDLGIPLDLDEATQTVAAGKVRRVDVGDVNGEVFLNNCVLGLYPAYRKERDALEARGVPESLAAMTGWAATLRRYPLMNARLTIADATRDFRTPYILIANNKHSMEGSQPWVRQRMDEGQLWAYILLEQARSALIRNAARIVAGTFQAEEDFEILQAAAFSLETEATEPRVSLDGEIAKIEAPLHFSSRPGGLKVVVPV